MQTHTTMLPAQPGWLIVKIEDELFDKETRDLTVKEGIPVIAWAVADNGAVSAVIVTGATIPTHSMFEVILLSPCGRVIKDSDAWAELEVFTDLYEPA